MKIATKRVAFGFSIFNDRVTHAEVVAILAREFEVEMLTENGEDIILIRVRKKPVA